jgi:hypothetical protein
MFSNISSDEALKANWFVIFVSPWAFDGHLSSLKTYSDEGGANLQIYSFCHVSFHVAPFVTRKTQCRAKGLISQVSDLLLSTSHMTKPQSWIFSVRWMPVHISLRFSFPYGAGEQEITRRREHLQRLMVFTRQAHLLMPRKALWYAVWCQGALITWRPNGDFPRLA